MMQSFRYAASCGFLLLLGACGGGIDGSDDGPGSEDPVPLSTKEDALRELSVAAELSGVLEGFSPGSLGGGGTVAEAEPKAALPCQVSGDEDYTNGTGNYRFNYFDTQLRAVSYERTLHRRCVSNGPNAGELYSLDGFREIGAAAVAGDGSQLQYRQIGSGNTPRETLFERRSNGIAVYQSEQQQLGTLQQRVSADGNRERQLIYRYQLEDSQDNLILVALGDSNGAFVIKDRDGVETSYEGRYAYRTSEPGCEGSASVTTQTAITRNGSGVVTGGRLQFDAGSKRAVISFAANGSGSLQLNGAAAVPLSAQEVSTALGGSACIPD